MSSSVEPASELREQPHARLPSGNVVQKAERGNEAEALRLLGENDVGRRAPALRVPREDVETLDAGELVGATPPVNATLGRLASVAGTEGRAEAVASRGHEAGAGVDPEVAEPIGIGAEAGVVEEPGPESAVAASDV